MCFLFKKGALGEDCGWYLGILSNSLDFLFTAGAWKAAVRDHSVTALMAYVAHVRGTRLMCVAHGFMGPGAYNSITSGSIAYKLNYALLNASDLKPMLLTNAFKP